MIYIHYNNGRVLQGVVLAFGDRLVRVAVKDSDDAVEFRLVNQVWVSEDCEVVKLDFAERICRCGERRMPTCWRPCSAPRGSRFIQRVM